MDDLIWGDIDDDVVKGSLLDWDTSTEIVQEPTSSHQVGEWKIHDLRLGEDVEGGILIDPFFKGGKQCRH